MKIKFRDIKHFLNYGLPHFLQFFQFPYYSKKKYREHLYIILSALKPFHRQT